MDKCVHGFECNTENPHWHVKRCTTHDRYFCMLCYSILQGGEGAGAGKKEAKASIIAYFTALVPEKKVPADATFNMSEAEVEAYDGEIRGWNSCREATLKAINQGKRKS